MEARLVVTILGISIALALICIVIIFAIKKKFKLSELPILIMAVGTFILALTAFCRYTVEARPNLFIYEISPRSTPQVIIYTLYNSGSGTAYDVDLVFNANVQFLDKDNNPVKKVQKEVKTENINHIYAKQKKISVLSYKLSKKAMEEFSHYTINIKYKITYKEKFFLILPITHTETGSFGLNPVTKLWLINPD